LIGAINIACSIHKMDIDGGIIGCSGIRRTHGVTKGGKQPNPSLGKLKPNYE
jgi:hypothetical protein